MSDVVEQVIQRHPEVKNEGIPEGAAAIGLNQSPIYDNAFFRRQANLQRHCGYPYKDGSIWGHSSISRTPAQYIASFFLAISPQACQFSLRGSVEVGG